MGETAFLCFGGIIMRKKKILVIDDDEMNLQIAKMVLEKKLACEVVCASNGF